MGSAVELESANVEPMYIEVMVAGVVSEYNVVELSELTIPSHVVTVESVEIVASVLVSVDAESETVVKVLKVMLVIDWE